MDKVVMKDAKGNIQVKDVDKVQKQAESVKYNNLPGVYVTVSEKLKVLDAARKQ